VGQGGKYCKVELAAVGFDFHGKVNFLYIFPCPYFIGFFFNHVGSAMGKQI